jgi:hypothetical protein
MVGQASDVKISSSSTRQQSVLRTRDLMRAVLSAVLVLAGTGLFAAQPAKPTIYIEAQNAFDTYLAAAISKKQVPADVVSEQSKATYVLKASEIEEKKESTGSKVTRCLFLYCAGIEDKANVSVQLIDPISSKVVWAYAVNKGRGQKNQQSMAEAVAKHLKEFLSKPRPVGP